jgi:hypothetical protein
VLPERNLIGRSIVWYARNGSPAASATNVTQRATSGAALSAANALGIRISERFRERGAVVTEAAAVAPVPERRI